MTQPKTLPNHSDIDAFIGAVAQEWKRDDAYALIELFEEVTQEKATMWGTSLIGFGRYRYKYASGHEGESFLVGFAPRKANTTIHISATLEGMDDLLADLGTFKKSVGCIYIKRLSDIDQEVLKALVRENTAILAKRYAAYN